jgi:hypothetical protein
MADEIVKPEISSSSIAAAMKGDTAKLGSDMVRIATERVDRDFSLIVLGHVKELVKHRAALHLALQKTQDEIALFDKRITAIDTGEFTVDGYGGIRYKDSTLDYR